METVYNIADFVHRILFQINLYAKWNCTKIFHVFLFLLLFYNLLILLFIIKRERAREREKKRCAEIPKLDSAQTKFHWEFDGIFSNLIIDCIFTT